jgi:hypothetical protein
VGEVEASWRILALPKRHFLPILCTGVFGMRFFFREKTPPKPQTDLLRPFAARRLLS